jgi:hypothetical protein
LVHFPSLNYFVGCDTKEDRSGEEDGHEEEDEDGEGDEEKGETEIAEGRWGDRDRKECTLYSPMRGGLRGGGGLRPQCLIW